MRENEFEKRVQEKMGGFNLPPSAEVWKEVERRIRKEKKRRFIFWWPLLLLLAGGGIAAGLLITNKKEKTGIVRFEKNNQNTIQSPIKEPIVQTPSMNNEQTGKNHPVDKKDSIAVPGTAPVKTKTTGHEPGIERQHIDNPVAKRSNNIKNPGIDKPYKNKKIVTTAVPGKEQDRQPPVTVTVPSKTVSPVTDPAKITDLSAGKKQETDKKNKQKETPPQIPDSMVIAEKTKATGKKIKKWDGGIVFAAGRSSVVNGLNLFNKTLYADPNFAFSTGPTSNPFNRSVTAMRSSFSWSAGFFVKRQLSEKLGLTIGLGYSYLSTKIYVGNRVDSTRVINNSNSQALSVGNFYRQAGYSTYTNQYHFVTLSGDISWRIINGHKLKVDWENGLAYGYLLGSTMLHYDRGISGYYQDNNLLTKHHVFFSTGLSLPLGKRFLVNPVASRSLTRVLKNADTIQAHYSNYGIRLRFLLNKK